MYFQLEVNETLANAMRAAAELRAEIGKVIDEEKASRRRTLEEQLLNETYDDIGNIISKIGDFMGCFLAEKAFIEASNEVKANQEATGEKGSVVILGGLTLVNTSYAYTFASLKRKNLISTTPLNDALNALILALKASAAAFVLLLTKKFKILS